MTNDLIINGFGSSNGGECHFVTINGKGTIKGDISATKIEVNGQASFQGVIHTKKLEINGSATLENTIYADKLSIDGHATCKSNITSNKLRVAGFASIKGNVKSEDISIEGKTTIDGNCDAEYFKVLGPIKITGTLNAEEIKIEPKWKCEINEIGCKNIKVKYEKDPFWNVLESLVTTTLTVGTIEGDNIHLENTTAKVVRGKNITIGKNCNIQLVEYTDTFSRSDNATVHTINQLIGGTYGINTR